MKELRIAKDLSLPLEVVTQAIAILAKRRAGKSYLMRRLVEQLFLARQQVVLVDPKGDQWGIRSSADGKSDGLGVVIFGGERGDVPLEPTSGALIAKLVVEESLSALLDLSLLRKHELATFMAAFLEDLYRLKAREAHRTPMMLVIDEADAVAPQKPQPNEARMLGAAQDIVRRGGQRGIGCCMVTQRSAVLSKDVLTQAQMLVTLRTIAPQDLAAIKAWIDVHGTLEQQKILMASLPSLPVGDAWFWSPGWPTDDGIFQRSHVLPISTYDSGASPKPGQKRAEPKRLSEIDLESVRRQMADTIERAKADDPRALRARIKELESIVNGKTFPVAPPAERVAVAVFDEARFTGLFEELQGHVDAVAAAASNAKQSIGKALVSYRNESRTAAKAAPAKATGPAKQPPTPRAQPKQSTEGVADLGPTARALLTAFAQSDRPLTTTQAAIIAGYSPKSGGVFGAMAALRKADFVEGDGASSITTAGLRALGPFDPLPTGPALAEHWYGQLNPTEAAILRIVVDAHPNGVSSSEAAEQAGYSPKSGGVFGACAKLRKLDLVHGSPEMVADERLV
jgi:hypothetical protein